MLRMDGRQTLHMDPYVGGSEALISPVLHIQVFNMSNTKQLNAPREHINLNNLL